MIKKVLANKKGQGLVEYALILVLVAIVVMVILALLGPAIGNVFSNIVAAIENPGGGGSIQTGSPVYTPPSGPSPATVTLSVTLNKAGTYSVSLASGSGSVSPGSLSGPGTYTITVSNASQHGSIKISGGGSSKTVSW
jgi:pilus assembly protein Flp/PilA